MSSAAMLTAISGTDNRIHRERQTAGVQQIIPVVDHHHPVIQFCSQLGHRRTDVARSGDQQRRCRLDVHTILDPFAFVGDLQGDSDSLVLTDSFDGVAEGGRLRRPGEGSHVQAPATDQVVVPVEVVIQHEIRNKPKIRNPKARNR